MAMIRALYIFLLSISTYSYAINPPSTNAISSSLGGASAAYSNLYSLHTNVAGLSITNEQIGISLYNQFGLSEYSGLSFIGGIESGNTTIGLSYATTTNTSLSIHQISGGVSMKIVEKLSIGIGGSFHHLTSNNAYYQPRNVITGRIGLLYRPTDKLQIGFQIDNPNRSKIANTLNERLPAQTRIGLSYGISENIKLYGDIFQVTNEQVDFYSGLELTKDQFAFRGGFSVNTQTVSVGIGYNTPKLKLNASGNYHPQLGISPMLTLGYAFKK